MKCIQYNIYIYIHICCIHYISTNAPNDNAVYMPISYSVCLMYSYTYGQAII